MARLFQKGLLPFGVWEQLLDAEAMMDTEVNTVQAEAERLRGAAEELRAALALRGAEGELAHELAQVRAERMKLAVEVHEATSSAEHAKAAAGKGRQLAEALAMLAAEEEGGE